MSRLINLSFVKTYKSIKAFSNVQLADLSVICGPNGSGKTHFLEAITRGDIICQDTNGKTLKSKKFDSTPTLSATNINYQNLIEGAQSRADARLMIEGLEELLAQGLQSNILRADGLAWIPINRVNLLSILIEHMLAHPNTNSMPQFNTGHAQAYQNTLNFTDPQTGTVRDRWSSFKKIIPARALKSIESFSKGKIEAVLFDLVQYQTFMQIDISLVFYRYFEEQQNNFTRQASGVKSLTETEFIERYGSPPWLEVNKLLKEYGFQHQIIPPNANDDPRAVQGYMAKAINAQGDIIEISDLSSGERVIIALLLSAYAAQQQENEVFQTDVPDIILFDEIDAHLHPSMTRMMFEVFQNSIIQKMSCSIIMTTHSPSTVALAPTDSIFRLMNAGSHTLERVDKVLASSYLSDGFINIIDGSQIVIVEGKDDPTFYQTIERALRANNNLPALPALHFIPASQSDDPSSGGGAKAAADWAGKLKSANLPNVHALLDNDGHRVDDGAIKVLRTRYSIENFVLDPLSLAITLIIDGKLVDIDEALPRSFPQVSNILSAPVAEVQCLVDAICGFIESHDPSLAGQPKMNVEYICGYKLSVPNWVCLKRGKDLVHIIREAFKKIDKAYIITKKDSDIELGYLLKMWSQYPLLFPVELPQTLMLLR